MNLIITPSKLRGTVTPPPSKSQAHRLVLAAALADGVSAIGNVVRSQDIAATIRGVEALGASVVCSGSVLNIRGIGGQRRRFPELPQFDCGESGSTLRFMIPIALAVAGGGVFAGHGRLMERPQKPYFDIFREKGILFSQGNGILTVKGSLPPGEYRLPGNVSSQFFTGLLYAMPLLNGASRIVSTTPLESAGYLAMTQETLQFAGVTVSKSRNAEGQWDDFIIPGPCAYTPFQRTVEADWSQAAFYYAANGLGNEVAISGLNRNSAQGDRIIAAYAAQLAAHGPACLDVTQCPDLVPALAVHAALRPGKTTQIVGAARLRIKESDRLDTVTDELKKLGADVEQFPDSLRISGVTQLHGGTVDSHNDHRIAMMLAVAATRADGPVRLLDAGCVAKSYPNFWEDYTALGGKIQEEKI